MSAWAKPGVKCVCIRSALLKLQAAFPSAQFPKAGVVYTIRDVRTVTVGPGVGEPCLFLVGIHNPIFDDLGNVEPGMPISAFRPLVTRSHEQDMAIFLPMLNSIPVGEDA